MLTRKKPEQKAVSVISRLFFRHTSKGWLLMTSLMFLVYLQSGVVQTAAFWGLLVLGLGTGDGRCPSPSLGCGDRLFAVGPSG